MPDKAVDGGPLKPPGYAVVNPSGNVRGPEIKLADVLGHLKPFKLRSPFAWIVGGLAIHGKTVGDIDILVRAKEGELSEEMWEVVKFRILRALPQELAERVEFHFADGKHGPFTDNVPLYDLELVDAGRDVVRMDKPPDAAELVKTDKPTSFVKLAKPSLAAPESERQTLDVLKAELVTRMGVSFPVLVQKGLDGVSVVLRKGGDRVSAYADDGKNLSNSLALAPILLALKACTHDMLVLVVVVEAWRGTKHLPLDVLTDIIRSTVGAPRGIRLSATVHDMLDLDGGVMTSMTPIERYDVVRKLGFMAPLFVAPSIEAKDASAAVDAASYMGTLPGSGGAVVKTTGPWAGLVWQHNITATAVAIERVETQAKGAYNYHIGLMPDGDVPPFLERRVGGQMIVYAGKTAPTGREYKAGDLIAVEATAVSVYDDGEVILWLPRVLDDKYRDAEAQTVVQVVEAAWQVPHVLTERIRGRPLEARTIEKEGLDFYRPIGWVESELFFEDWLNRDPDLSVMDYDSAMETIAPPDETEKEDASPYMRYPGEGRTWRYVVQQHSRGASIHSDLRVENGGGKLIGWTLNTQIAGKVKKPIETMAALRALKGHSKIDWRTGKWAQRSRDGKLINAQIVSERKGVQPKAWLTFQGVTKPGAVGSTANHPGVFVIAGKGEVEYGAQRGNLHEYFFHGRALNGRFIFRQLGPDAFKQFVVAPAEGAVPADEATWVFIKPLDQTPYVLSSRAIAKGWMPPKGVSALPKALRSRVPANLRYWTATGADALDRRRELRKQWLKDGVVRAADDEPTPQ